MLILFDIDGTLLRSERAGISAMTSAMAELHSGLQVNWEARVAEDLNEFFADDGEETGVHGGSSEEVISY